MGEVINDERQHDQPAHYHVTRGKRRLHIIALAIPLGSGASIIDREADRDVNVNDYRNEEKNSDEPQQRAEIAQMLRVAVDPIRAEEDLQVAEKMADDKQDQNDPRNR